MPKLSTLVVDGKLCTYEYVESVTNSRLILLRTPNACMQIAASDSPISSTQFHVSLQDKKGQFQDLYISKARYGGNECLRIEKGTLLLDKECTVLFFDLLTMFYHTKTDWKTAGGSNVESVTITSVNYDKKKRATNTIVHIAETDSIRSKELIVETVPVCHSEQQFPQLANAL